MPIPLAASAAIGAGSQLAGGFLNSAAQNEQNRQSERFSWEMYKHQRKDALEFWNMQNTYNSPQEQMKRFQEAGLNPHLVYGQGNNGNAAPISTPDVQPVQRRSPEPGNGIANAGAGGLALLNGIYDLDIKGAQADNLKLQGDAILEDTLYKRALRNRSEFDLGFKSEFRDYYGDALREEVRQRRTSTDLSINEDARRAAMNSSNLREAFERMENMQEQRKNMATSREHTRADIERIKKDVERTTANIRLLRQQGVLNDWAVDLSKMNLRPQDGLWQRLVGSLLSGKETPVGKGLFGKPYNIWKKQD